MKPILRMSDPQVTRIMAEKQAQTKFVGGRTYRVHASPAAGSFADRFPDGCWSGQPCFIIGGGPSLKGFDFDRLRGRGRVIAINKAFKDVPFADIMLAMDHPLIGDLSSGRLGDDYRQAFASFEGAKLWLDLSTYSYPGGIYSIPSAGATGWSKSLSQGLVHGNNSGYGALNLAMVLGADPIYLLGYDCSKGPAGEKNYHNGYLSGSNPDAVNIFKREIEAGAKLIEGAHRIINLNPKSALTCFPFGDVDKVLPASRPSAGGITVITPTGDRPLAFRLCREWMKNQTRRPDQWLIVDDGKVPMNAEEMVSWANVNMPGVPVGIRREPRSDDPKHTLILNLQTAIPYVTGDKILIMEDDEYYAPGYIEAMSKHIEHHEVVGIKCAKYYHLPTGGYANVCNNGHASLAETGFRRSFLPELETIWAGDMSLDMRIWKKAEKRGFLFDDKENHLYVGMKGLPGRTGIGAGHRTEMYRMKDSAKREMLKSWIPKDYQIYLDIWSGKLTTENFGSYFPPAALPVTGITVCWNTKDLIERAYNSVRKFYPEMPIVIIDGSDAGDPCAAYVRGLASPITTVIQPGHNIGHGRGMCMGIEKAKTPYALMFDSDIELLEPCIPAMLAMMEPDTFGVGYLEDIGYDGFRYKVAGHAHREGALPCLHPYFQLINIENYRKFHPYVHHGMPVYLTMLDIHKKGLSKNILKQFPGLVNNVPKIVRHDSSGTGFMRIKNGLSHIDGAWVLNKGLV